MNLYNFILLHGLFCYWSPYSDYIFESISSLDGESEAEEGGGTDGGSEGGTYPYRSVTSWPTQQLRLVDFSFPFCIVSVWE